MDLEIGGGVFTEAGSHVVTWWLYSIGNPEDVYGQFHGSESFGFLTLSSNAADSTLNLAIDWTGEGRYGAGSLLVNAFGGTVPFDYLAIEDPALGFKSRGFAAEWDAFEMVVEAKQNGVEPENAPMLRKLRKSASLACSLIDQYVLTYLR